MSTPRGPIGPYDLAYKPERFTALAWSLLSGWDRYELACRESARFRADREREMAAGRQRPAEDIAEFGARFSLVDLDGIPARAWGSTPGSRCSQCRLDADWPGKQHGQSGLECWLWQAAYFYSEQAGICGWCGDAMAANLVKTAIDHVIPRSLGGPDTRWNRQLLHVGCNSSKGRQLTPRAVDLAAAHGVVLTAA